jgi:hypothetical protein
MQGAPASAEIMAGLSPQKARGLVGLFSTEGPRGPVSEAVTRHWASPRGDIRTASLSNAPRFFPRISATDAPTPGELPAITPDVTGSLQPGQGKLVDAPMPPVRPNFDLPLVVKTRTAPQAKTGPLDLKRFLTARGGA